jgi:hypothetical protein
VAGNLSAQLVGALLETFEGLCTTLDRALRSETAIQQ